MSEAPPSPTPPGTPHLVSERGTENGRAGAPPETTPRSSWRQLPLALWAAWQGWWRPAGQRALTPLEAAAFAHGRGLAQVSQVAIDALTAERRRLSAALDDRDREVRRLTLELELATSRLKVAQVEIAALAGVVARDRKRVEAETAALAQRVAKATAFQPER